MPECYIGRGTLYGRKLSEPTAGFTRLTGESEVTLQFQEEAGEVVDSRYGRQEAVDWFVRSTRASLEAQVFDWNDANLALLLKGTKATVAAGAGRSYDFPNPVGLQALYPVDRAKILAGYSMEDAVAAALVEGTHYSIDADMGLVEFLDTAGFTQPFTLSYDNALYSELGVNTTDSIALELMFKGFNRKTGNKVMATFYRGELRIADAVKLISKEFADMKLTCDLIADFEHHADDILSHYGKVIKL
jgi:hypothetical protein